ncbi:hypothetical protein ES288_A10G159700v1 [Gossypium darwinii]|uniref:Uncharacterized protein n=1 Tax=Gossypium darwinii TaxID=34276 RepID=A0A5D2F0F4_GOSDA|nr:hypothetical protein ES288_A10G159700v1 [Gossypium darwinii]
MAPKISPLLSISVLLLSLSLLLPPSSTTTNTHLIGVGVPCHPHAGSGVVCDPPYAVATQTQDHN